MAKVKDLLVNGSSRFIGKIYASDQFISQVANGTAPFVVSSSTVVANLNADMTDGLHVHTGRNNEVNKIVRTDAYGYIQTGYINTNVGTQNLAISRIFYEYNNDGYIRKMSPSSFFSVFENSGNDISITVAGQNRKLTVGYASNSDKLDGYHVSDLTKFYLSPMEGGAPASSAKSWFENTMPSGAGAIVYNVPGSEKTIIVGKSTGAYGHMLQLNYDDKYLRILRYYVGNWRSDDWEKISAGYADSAGDADKLDGYHANDFATAGHTHYIGDKPASDLSSTYPQGISVGGIYANGYPFHYGSTITAYGSGGYFQIAGQWNSNVTGDSNYDFPTEMYIRGRRDSYDVWTTWTRVLTDRNYTNVLDNRYYTETEADNRFVNVTGDTMSGALTCNNTIKSTYYGPGFANDVDAGKWAYTRFKSGSNEWHIGTNSSDAYIGAGGAFEIRSAGASYSGISVRYNTSNYGKLVVSVPSGECSIGYYSNGAVRWTVGCSDGSNYGWYQGIGGGWKMTLNTSGYLTATGFIKSGSSDSYVLLGGGGHKAESGLSVNYANSAGTTNSLGSGALKYMCSLYATSTYNAYKITTDWHKSSNIMPTINIRGYAYGSVRTIDCDIIMYHYDNDACNYSLTNKGSYPIRVWQAIENDVQVFYINPGEYFGMFNVFVYGGIGTGAFSNWSMTTVDDVSGTEIGSKPIATSITGDADTVDGYHASSFSLSTHTHTFNLGNTTITTNGGSYSGITGPFNIYTNANAANAFSILRDSAAEGVRHWVDDGQYHIDYTNDETSSSIHIRIINTDTESGNKTNTTDYHYYLDCYGNFHPGSNNTGSIGTAGYKWANMYATTFHGSLDGNASTATSAAQATNLTPENTAHYFRDPNNSTWRGGMIWGSAGSESMSFVVASSGTRFQFVGGSDIANWGSSTWQSANPYLTIYSSGIVTPGSATASGGFIKSGYDNTYVLLAGGGHKAESNLSVSYASSAGDADTSNRAKFLETFQQNSTTNTYGSQYPIWAQWSDATNVRLKCTNYTVWTDKANYASNAGNADKLDDIDSTGFLAWTGMSASGGSSAPFQTSVDFFNNTANLNAGARMIYNYPGNEYTILYTRRSDNVGHGSILRWGYPDNYIRMIRMISGSPQTSDWEKISAGYADSAGNSDTIDGYHYNNLPYVPKLAWHSENSGESVNDLVCGTSFYYTTHGAPTNGVVASFTGTHNSYQLQIQGKYYGKEFWYRSKNGDNGTWNAWTQVIDTNNIGLQSVTYANSAGNADTVDNKHASTLLHLDGYYYIPGNGTNSSTKLWSKIGSITFTGAWQDCGGSLTFYEWEARYMMGELKFNIRTSSSKSNAGADIVWMNLTNKKFENSFIICRTGNGTYDIYFEYPAISYINIKFYIISQYDNGYITWQNGSALTSTEPTYVNEKFVSSLTSWVGNADYATSAGTASTANSVAWANITGKPSSFNPSSHSHPYLPTTQVSQEQASNDDWIKAHALSTLRGHVYNTHNLEWQYLFGISSGKTYGSILRTSYGNGTPRIQVMGLTNGTWSSWREVAYDDNTVKKDGTGASGTWGISITGNAGYASSAGYADSAGNANTVDGYYETSFYRHRGDYGKSYTAASTEYSLGPGTYTTSESGYSGTLLSFNSSGSASAIQFWTHYSQGNLYYRTSIDSNRWGKTDGSWTRILDSDSYNYYAPTLTGSGASGTWNISISGNAATATNAENISSIYPQLAASLEADEINVKRQIAWNNWGDYGYMLEAAIDFNWYETHNLFGVIRGGNTDSAGFGWMYSSDGSTYTPIARLSPDGHLYLASSLTISGAISGGD